MPFAKVTRSGSRPKRRLANQSPTLSVAADDLVRDEQHSRLAADLPGRLEVSVRRDEDSAGADDRLAEERCDALRPRLLDGLAQGVGRVPGDAHGVSDELPEPRLEGVHADDARTVGGHAVIGALARDDDRAVRLTDQAPVAAGELGGALDRLGAAAREEDDRLLHRGDRRDPLREIEGRPRRDVAVGGVRCDLHELGVRRVRDLLTAPTHVAVPEARGGVQVAPALLVPEPDALGSVDHELAAPGHGVHVGDRMPEARHRLQPTRAGSRLPAVRLTAGTQANRMCGLCE